jgi:hypothetical protein
VIVPHHAREPEQQFLLVSLPKLVIEFREKAKVRFRELNVANGQPLPAEIRQEALEALVGQHAANLLLEHSRLAQAALLGNRQQFLVGNRSLTG